MPIIATLLVTKTLSTSPASPHWALRRRAASLLQHLTSRYGQTYHTLIPRITRTLYRAFMDPSKALTTHYGAILGLAELGHSVIKETLIPNIPRYMSLLGPVIESLKNNSPQNQMDHEDVRQMEAQHVYNALLVSIHINITFVMNKI